MAALSTPQVGRTDYLKIDGAIGTYPNYTSQSGTTTTFVSTQPNVITVTGWPLSYAETVSVYGLSFWLFDPVNKCLAYGKWNIPVSGTLVFNCIDGFPKWTTSVSTGLAYGIPNRDAKNFDQCSVQNIGGTGDVTVDDYVLSNQAQYINIERQGNANIPIIIDATMSIAQVCRGLI